MITKMNHNEVEFFRTLMSLAEMKHARSCSNDIEDLKKELENYKREIDILKEDVKNLQQK